MALLAIKEEESDRNRSLFEKSGNEAFPLPLRLITKMRNDFDTRASEAKARLEAAQIISAAGK